MLTQIDLNKIGNLVDQKLNDGLKPINQGLLSLKNEVNKLEESTSKRLIRIEKEVRKINWGNKTVANYFDHAYLDHDKRITKIESHLGFQSI